MTKIYRNLGPGPIYSNGRLVPKGETLTLPAGCEPGSNVELVGEQPDPPETLTVPAPTPERQVLRSTPATAALVTLENAELHKQAVAAKLNDNF